MQSPIHEVRSAIYDLAGVIGARRSQLPTFGTTEDGARPHVEERDGQLSLVIVERGEEIERRRARDQDELLYWVFEDVTHLMASDWELGHRVEGQDSRILLFKKQIELLDRLSRRWSARYREENGELLRAVGIEGSSNQP